MSSESRQYLVKVVIPIFAGSIKGACEGVEEMLARSSFVGVKVQSALPKNMRTNISAELEQFLSAEIDRRNKKIDLNDCYVAAIEHPVWLKDEVIKELKSLIDLVGGDVKATEFCLGH